MRPGRVRLVVAGGACAALLGVGLPALLSDRGGAPAPPGDRTVVRSDPRGTGPDGVTTGAARPATVQPATGSNCRRRALGARGDLDGAGRRDFAPRCIEPARTSPKTPG